MLFDKWSRIAKSEAHFFIYISFKKKRDFRNAIFAIYDQCRSMPVFMLSMTQDRNFLG